MPVYALSRNVAHMIAHTDTLTTFGCSNQSEIQSISQDAFICFTIGEPIPLLRKENGSPDEIMRVEIEKIISIQKNLLQNITYVGELINPAFVSWQGRLLIAIGRAWGVGSYLPNDNIEFSWLNHSDFQFPIGSENLLGVGTTLAPLNIPNFMGQDPRFMLINPNKALIVFTNRFVKPTTIGIAFVELNFTDHQQPSTVLTRVFFEIKPDFDVLNHQKNWSPFSHNESILFVQNINPLRIVRVDHDLSPGTDGVIWDIHRPLQAITVSAAPFAKLKWGYGHIRGGTNAVFVGDRYLALFHSR